MKRFLRQISCFVLIQLAVFSLVRWLHEPDPAHYLAATNVKHQLLQSTPSPRLIFIGGSNVAFGIDSDRFARTLHLSPVNMGLHVGLGLPFLLNEVREHLKPGDVVVLSPEYQHFNHEQHPFIILDVLEQRSANLKYVSLDTVPEILDKGVFPHVRMMCWKVIRDYTGYSGETSKYHNQRLNEYGDVVWHRGEPSPRDVASWPLFLPQFDPAPRRIRQVIARLNDFHDECRERGVTVYFSFPPVPQPHLARERDRELVHRIEREIAAHLTIERLDQPGDMTFPVDHFFDTCYHLNGKGIDRRSELLAQRLHEALNGNETLIANR